MNPLARGDRTGVCARAARRGLLALAAVLGMALPVISLPAAAAPAIKVGPAHLPNCGPGGFVDLKGDCWTCPAGFQHDNLLLPPTDGRVCKRPGAVDKRAGTRIASSVAGICTSGWLSLHDGGCYTCPQGYSHDLTLSGNQPGVCHRSSGDAFSSATRLAGNVLCSSGFFDLADNGSCWTCPAGAPVRTTAGVKSDQACASLQVVSASAADGLLRPGDVMFKLLDRHSAATSFGIAASQLAMMELEHLFEGARKSGDAAAVHIAVYLGNGRTAEAYGGVSDAAVGTRPLSDHAGFMFYVFRFNDPALAKEATEVARTWANGRMKYLPPVHVPVTQSEFSALARLDALRYGLDSATAGGPRNEDRMFCSQFAIAVYQAAATRRLLLKNPALKEADVEVPRAVRVHAINTSPLVLHSQMIEASGPGNPEMSYLGRVLVQR